MGKPSNQRRRNRYHGSAQSRRNYHNDADFYPPCIQSIFHLMNTLFQSFENYGQAFLRLFKISIIVFDVSIFCLNKI